MLFISCSMGRYLDSPAFVLIDGPYSVVIPEGEFKYLGNYESDKYENKFLSELESELERHNIYSMRLEPATSDKLFAVIITKLIFNEEFTTEVLTVDSLTETQKVYNVVSCYANAEFDINYSGYGGNELLKSSSAYSSKEEKFSNKRTFFQWVFGVNKDNTIFTYTELEEEVFIDLCEKTAKRTASKISKVLYKQLK